MVLALVPEAESGPAGPSTDVDLERMSGFRAYCRALDACEGGGAWDADDEPLVLDGWCGSTQLLTAEGRDVLLEALTMFEYVHCADPPLEALKDALGSAERVEICQPTLSGGGAVRR